MKPDKEPNEKHATNPVKGDYWHEMFCPVCVIVNVNNDVVTYLVPDKKNEYWDEENPVTKTKAEFKEWLSYDNIDGYWCDVVPKHFDSEDSHD